MDNALPSNECQKKIKLYSLFKEIVELSDTSLVPHLIDPVSYTHLTLPTIYSE